MFGFFSGIDRIADQTTLGLFWMIKWGDGINILSTIPGAHLVVENYWFCQMIIEWEGIMNYQFGRI